jgi:hypothetical protein
MPSILRLIGFLSAAFTLALTVLMLFNSRKERRIGTVSPLLSAAVSLLLLPVFMLLSRARLNLVLGLPILAVGLLIGFLRGMTTRLYYKDGQVMGRNSMLFLLGWGGSLVLAQLLSTLGSALLASIGLLPMFLSTGTQVGMNGTIFLRRLMMQPAPEIPSVGGGRAKLPVPARTASPPTLPERERPVAPAGPKLVGTERKGAPQGLPER